jgi:hypothetical protein
MTGYAISHEGKAYTPNGRDDSIKDVDAHNRELEQAEIAWLATKPERVTLYVGKTLGDGMGCDRHGPTSRRALTTFLGTKVGTCALSSSWRVNSYVGSRMYQIYARINGVDYTGRGFGEGMSVNLRKCAKQKA